MESDAAEDSRSIIDKGNIKGFNTLGKHGYDSPLGKHFSSSLIMNIPGKNYQNNVQAFTKCQTFHYIHI